MNGDLISREKVLGIIAPRLNSAKIGSLEYQRLYSILEEIRRIPVSNDLDEIIEQLDKCSVDTVFQYNKKEGVLYEVEADVWASLEDGVKIRMFQSE